MKVFWDVDNTLVSPGILELRPGSIEALSTICSLGHQNHLWSSAGRDYARLVAERVEIASYITDYADKICPPEQEVDVVVDDDEEFLNRISNSVNKTILIKAYHRGDDTEMGSTVQRIVGAFDSAAW